MPDHNESAEEAVSRLTKELDDLKQRYAAVCEERDRFAERNTDLRMELDCLQTARAAMSEVVAELQERMETLQNDLLEAERYRQAALKEPPGGQSPKRRDPTP